ncbi:MAG: pilus assembly protein [Rhodospirillales bacterium]|nr:pilus assembly protein [Rhodospirillales bacterium]
MSANRSWHIFRGLRAVAGDRRGAIALELAMAIPVIVLLVLSGIEITRFLLLNQKIERASATMADLVSQSEGLSEGALGNLFAAATHVVAPYDIVSDGRILVSSLAGGDGGATVLWQRTFGTASGVSTIGTEGGPASLPAGFILRTGEAAIVAEVLFDYRPAFFDRVLEPSELHAFAIHRPRIGTPASLAP